jgi:hypothetical protein
VLLEVKGLINETDLGPLRVLAEKLLKTSDPARFQRYLDELNAAI